MNDLRKLALNATKIYQKQFNEHWEKAKYTESIVAFVDVMGTKEIFFENPNDFALFRYSSIKAASLFKTPAIRSLRRSRKCKDKLQRP